MARNPAVDLGLGVAPRLDGRSVRQGHRPAGVDGVPRFPRRGAGIARIEYQPSTRNEGTADVSQRPVPVVIADDADLRIDACRARRRAENEEARLPAVARSRAHSSAREGIPLTKSTRRAAAPAARRTIKTSLVIDSHPKPWVHCPPSTRHSRTCLTRRRQTNYPHIGPTTIPLTSSRDHRPHLARATTSPPRSLRRSVNT